MTDVRTDSLFESRLRDGLAELAASLPVDDHSSDTAGPVVPLRRRRFTAPVLSAAAVVALLAAAALLPTLLDRPDHSPRPTADGTLLPIVPTTVRDPDSVSREAETVADDPPGPAALLAHGIPGWSQSNPYVLTSDGEYRTLPKVVDGSWASITVRLFPDGTRVAFTDQRKLVVLDLRTGEERVPLTSAEGGITLFAVSPDGRQLLVAINGVPYLVDSGSGRRTELNTPGRLPRGPGPVDVPVPGPTGGAFSRDGQKVAVSWVHGTGQTLLEIQHLRGGEDGSILTPGRGFVVGPGAFSPDGRFVLLGTGVPGHIKDVHTQAVDLSAVGTAARRVPVDRAGVDGTAPLVVDVWWRTDDTVLVAQDNFGRGGSSAGSSLIVRGLDGAERETILRGAEPVEVAGSIAPTVKGVDKLPALTPDAMPRPSDPGAGNRTTAVVAALAGVVALGGITSVVVRRMRRRAR